MASRNVNAAVVAYRAIKKLSLKLDDLEETLNRKVEGLTEDEMSDYFTLTTEIDAALDAVEGGPAYAKVAALKNAGLDS
jgi:hypothetical protein